MPTYNREDYLAEAIQSCLNQTYQDIELLVINDGCTDSTSDLMEYFLSLDNRIKYFIKDKNTGLADSENFGIEKAKGEIIARADSDDIQEPNKIQILVDNMQGYDFAYTGYYHANKFGEIWEEVHPKPFTLENIRGNDCASGCSFACRKYVYDKVRYRSEFLVNEDKAFIWDLYKAGFKGNMIDIPTFRYRMLPDGMSYKRREEVLEIDKIINMEIDDEKNKNIWSK